MSREHSSIKSKIYLSSACSLVLLLVSCGGTRVVPDAPDHGVPRLEREVRKASDIPVPPWQVWRRGRNSNYQLSQADEVLNAGKLEEAIYLYRDVIDRTESPEIEAEAFYRICATHLKLGHSDRVLEQISRHLADHGLTAAGADQKLALLAAYSYLHKRDFDQAIAWFVSSYRIGGDQDLWGSRARTELKRLAASLGSAEFAQYEQRWRADRYAGRIFARERIRRAQGGSVQSGVPRKLYSPETYRVILPPEVPASVMRAGTDVKDGDSSSEIASLRVAGDGGIGVLLPLSGRFSEHALKVKEGILLAQDDFGPGTEITFLDTKGDAFLAEQEYERLVNEYAVSLVLGPLLVKTTERVALKSRELGVPFYIFYKKKWCAPIR